MLNCLTDPWIPTVTGTAGLLDLLMPDAPDLQTGDALQDLALRRLLIALTACPVQELDPDDFELFGVRRPFLQVPLAATEGLKWQPVSVLQVHRGSGRSPTPLFGLGRSPSLDRQPSPLTVQDAARHLVTFQACAPSNGRSAWGYTFDAPLARTAALLVEGATLHETLELNRPTQAAPSPFWARDLPWDAWRGGGGQAFTPWTALAYPWLTVSLQPGETVSAVRLAGGPRAETVSEMSPDPHAVHEVTRQTRTRAPLTTLKNPADLCAERLLVTALHLAVSGAPDAQLPVGLIRARAGQGPRPRRIRLTVPATRTGQPVLLDVLEASLPWPAVGAAAEPVLREALHAAQRLGAAVHRSFTGTHSAKRAAELTHASNASRTYWQRLWPDLALALTGEDAPVDPVGTAQLVLEQHLAGRSARAGVDVALHRGPPVRSG